MIYGVNIQTYYGAEASNPLVNNLKTQTSLRMFPIWGNGPFGQSWKKNFSTFPPSEFQNNYEVCLNEEQMNNRYGNGWRLQDFIEMVTNAMQNLPMSQISAVEIFNEVEYSNKWSGYLAQNGALGYSNMLKAAYPIIKKANPNASVIAFGGLANFENYLIPYYNNDNFTESNSYKILQAVWQHGASVYCDAIAVHSYPHCNLGKQFYIDLNEYPSFQGVKCKYTIAECMQKQSQALYNIARKPIYYDETGISVSSLDQNGQTITLQQQAAYLTQAFSVLATFPGALAVKWWDLTGIAPNGQDFGLFDLQGNARPSYMAFQSFLEDGDVL